MRVDTTASAPSSDTYDACDLRRLATRTATGAWFSERVIDFEKNVQLFFSGDEPGGPAVESHRLSVLSEHSRREMLERQWYERGRDDSDSPHPLALCTVARLVVARDVGNLHFYSIL